MVHVITASPSMTCIDQPNYYDNIWDMVTWIQVFQRLKGDDGSSELLVTHNQQAESSRASKKTECTKEVVQENDEVHQINIKQIGGLEGNHGQTKRPIHNIKQKDEALAQRQSPQQLNRGDNIQEGITQPLVMVQKKDNFMQNQEKINATQENGSGVRHLVHAYQKGKV